MYSAEKRTITTERLILRPFELSDAENCYKHCNNYNIYKSTLYLPYPYPIESALSWIPTHKENFDNDVSYEFAITDKATGEFFGAIGLSNNKNHKNGELGYWIGEEFWNKGYGTEAVKAVIEFAFSEKKLHKVMGKYFASNSASGKVMEKAGMSYEGTLVDHIIKEDNFETLVYYGIINPN